MRSKSTFLFATIVATILTTTTIKAQFNPGLPAGFGIDGDVLSGQSQNITGSAPQGSFDWFRKAGGGANVGYGVIDTTGTFIYNAQVAAGLNVTFTRGQAYPRYSVVNGYLLLDARYGRDEFGLSGSNGKKDFTTYTNGSKNGDNPTGWGTTPTGGTVADKADIIDTYIHMRRDGIVINNTNPSPLILAMGVNTVGNTGDRYIDFELFKERIEYNTTTGVFSNSGSASTGGHSAWTFNPNGTVKDMGDLSVSFSFGTAGVSEIAIYIWVAQTVYNSANPVNFNFISGQFFGSTYGYAKIEPLSASAFKAWASVSSATTSAAPWGTNSKFLGGSPSNYYSSNYAQNDFAEVAMDLTSLGIDPALSVGSNACVPPFTRVMAKTRSSASFTSALQDFTGPYEFLDAPQAPATIAPPAVLKCNATSTTLSPSTVVPGAVYTWSTTNGNIVSDPNATSVTVNQAGKYYLSSAIVAGCPTNTDSTIVNEDYYKPVATAFTIGSIDLNNPLSTAHIQGGDVAASNFATPYGGSAGLTWKWTGPNGYTSTSRNNIVTKAGVYNLELTEQRNGCKEYAATPVPAFSTLPVKITEFSATKKENDHVKINWKVMDETPSTVELMRSYSGNEFSVIAIELPLSASQDASYHDNVANRNGNKVYYQLKVTEQSGAIVYSKIINITFGATNSSPIVLSPNPANNYTVIGITSTTATTGQIQLVDMAGRMLQQKNVRMEKGANQIMLSELEKLKPGIYMVRIMMEGEFKTQKLLIQ